MTAGRLGKEQRALARLLFFVFIRSWEAINRRSPPAASKLNCLSLADSGIINTCIVLECRTHLGRAYELAVRRSCHGSGFAIHSRSSRVVAE